MADKVILHVGSPKTGTSFLQDMFFSEKLRLQSMGILYPADRFDRQFLAAVDLMGLKWGGLEVEAVGSWDRIADEVRAWDGTAFVSHEILARASREEVARALESLGGEIHVVVSARDLARQIPAEWQENIKHRRHKTFAEHLAGIRDPERDSNLARWFWGVQEIPDVLDRWGSSLPPEHVHLVTVPPSGAPKDLLWHRFAEAFGLDPAAWEPSDRANASLGVAEVAVLRELNIVLDDVIENEDYRALVREWLVHQNLSKERSSARLSIPPEIWTWADELSRAWVADLAGRGYDVIGDLDDLLPVPPPPWVDPDSTGIEERAAVLVRATTAMTVEAANLRGVIADRDADIARLHRILDRTWGIRFQRLKERLVARAENDNRLTAWSLRVYRRLRRRPS